MASQPHTLTLKKRGIQSAHLLGFCPLPVVFFGFLPGFRGVLPGFLSHSGYGLSLSKA